MCVHVHLPTWNTTSILMHHEMRGTGLGAFHLDCLQQGMGRTNHKLQMNRFKFKTLEKLPIILEEYM